MFVPTEILLVVAVAALLVVLVLLVVLIFALRSLPSRLYLGRATVTESVSDKLQRLHYMAEVNKTLVSTKEGMRALVSYKMSEAAIAAALERVESVVGEMSESDSRSQSSEDVLISDIVEAMDASDRRPLKWFWNGASWVKRNKGKIAEKVFGKINSLLSGMAGGGGGS